MQKELLTFNYKRFFIILASTMALLLIGTVVFMGVTSHAEIAQVMDNIRTQDALEETRGDEATPGIVNPMENQEVSPFTGVHFAPYVKAIFFSAMILMALVVILYWLGLAGWMYERSFHDGLYPAIWTPVVFLTNLAGVIAYLIFRSFVPRCAACGHYQLSGDHCVACGKPFYNECSCGHKEKAGHAYCSNCGKKIDTSDHHE